MNNMINSLIDFAMAVTLVIFTACTTTVADVTNESDELSAEVASNPYEWDTAVAGTPPATFSGGCVTMTGAKACFEKHGDRWWVLDTIADGHSATASWENFLNDGTDSWPLWRSGSCVNN